VSHESDICRRGSVVDVYGAMFERVAEDDSIDDLVEQQMVINFRLNDPAADIWVDGPITPSRHHL